MTLRTWLTTLPADPTDPNSPPLYASPGDLTAEATRYVTSNEYGGRPYVLLLGVADAAVQRYDGGAARQLTPLDVVCEMPPPASRAVMQALYDRVMQAPQFVDELQPGLPLAGRLVYAGGLRTENRYQMPEWLTWTIRFNTEWLSNY